MPQTLGSPTSRVPEQIISRVAALEGADPAEIPPLYEAVDPDALEALFARTNQGEIRVGEVTFPYAGHDVTIHFDGDPVVTIE